MTTTELTRPETVTSAVAPPAAGGRVRVDLWVGVGLLVALVVARAVTGMI